MKVSDFVFDSDMVLFLVYFIKVLFLSLSNQAFSAGLCLPNQLNPDLTGMPMSLSPHLRFGSLSIRRFYWELKDLFHKVSSLKITVF